MSTQPQGDAELVEVFDTQQESEAMVVQGLLSSAGIESMITNLDAPQDVLPGVGGVVVRVNAQEGQQVKIDDSLLVLEAMKMETTITSPVSGKVKKFRIGVGESVQSGQVLVDFE